MLLAASPAGPQPARVRGDRPAAGGLRASAAGTPLRTDREIPSVEAAAAAGVGGRPGAGAPPALDRGGGRARRGRGELAPPIGVSRVIGRWAIAAAPS